MARFPNFPRFPYRFDNEISSTLYRIIAEWATTLIRENNQADIVLQQRKIEKDEDGSIQVDGRINVGDTGSAVTPKAGDIRFNSSTNKFQGYNGTTWQDFH